MAVLLKLVGMTWLHRWRLILAYVTFFVAIAFSLGLPWILGEAIDKLLIYEDGQIVALNADLARSTLLWFALALLAVSLMRGLADFARVYTSDTLAQRVAYDLRNQMYDKLQHLSFAFHDNEHTGNLMAKVTSDIEAVRRFIMMGLLRSLEVAARVAAIMFLLVYLNWELTLLSLVFVPLLVLRSTMVMAKLRWMWLHVQEVMGELITILQENLTGVHVVRAFSSEEFEKRKFARKAQQLREEYFQNEKLQGINSAWMTLYFTVALGLVFWYGGWEVIRADLTAGGFAKFVLYLGQLIMPIRMMAFIINSFSRAISSGQRLFDVLDAPSAVPESPGCRDMGRAKGHVRFENVSFSYDGKVPALKNVNISVPPGSIVALLGAPGSGKTTIANLLPRFYDATGGKITIDGEDIREFSLASLRRNVGIVQQDVFLFTTTIRDNIAYGATGASFDDVMAVAKVAQLHDQIMELPAGYDTWVGERGTTLSGGQRQRVSIARTLLIDPPVLILDDSTSSVDVETERFIHEAMSQVMVGRTTFVIAHRLSTVREADLILVLQDGEIVEQGTHEELMARRGIYQDIYELQLRPQEELLLDATLSTGDGGDN